MVEKIGAPDWSVNDRQAEYQHQRPGGGVERARVVSAAFLAVPDALASEHDSDFTGIAPEAATCRPGANGCPGARMRVFNLTGIPMIQRTLLLVSALLAILTTWISAAEPDVVRIPIECEDMEGVKWGP